MERAKLKVNTMRRRRLASVRDQLKMLTECSARYGMEDGAIVLQVTDDHGVTWRNYDGDNS